MVFYATFNNISVIVWRSFLLVEETGVSGENHRLPQGTDKCLCFFFLSYCLSLHSEFHVVKSLRFPRKNYVRFVFTWYLFKRVHVLFTLFVFVCAHSGDQHILCCVFVLFVFVLRTLCCKFICIVHFWFPNRYSLKLMYTTTVLLVPI